jgi:hypothetical protein
MTSVMKTTWRHLDDSALRLWMHLVEAGGYWSVREMRLQWFAAIETDEVRDMVDRLHDNGLVREQRRGGKHPAYGVTTLCKAPPGYEHLLGIAA